jgi:hypothetical protein
MKESSVEDFDSLFVEKRSSVKVGVLIIVISVLVLTAIYTFLSVSSVREHMKLAQDAAINSPQVNPDLLPQLKEKAWIESRLKMAAGDSIGLSIDLEAQRIQMELKGVVIMSAKIRDYAVSGYFRKMDGNVYFNVFGSPLTIQKFNSSIDKNPLKVVVAPKDTIEAQAAADAAAKKDSLAEENVFWTVKLDRGFDLDIQGIDSVADAQNRYKLGEGFEFERNLKNIANSFSHIVHFQKPTYQPEILISINKNEAKAILRALPRNALVTIKI